MQRDVATTVNMLMLEFGARLDDSLAKVMQSSSEEEFEHYRKAVSKILEIMLFEVMNPIYKAYPDLKPTQLD